MVHLKTDLACVHPWVSDTVSENTRVRTKASPEMLTRCRLSTLMELTAKYWLTIDVAHARFHENQVNILTKIACCTSRRNRSRVRYVRRTAGIRSYTNHSSMREVHVIFCITEVSKAAVRTMVRYYEAYQSIDPAIDAVWIKYPHGRYTTQFKKGNVTGPQLVLVNGIPRHIKDLRPCHGSFSSKDDRSDVI